MLRKSYNDIAKMKEELKVMNETMDKKQKQVNSNNIINNNNYNIKIGNKQMLKPIIVKKENNPNIIANKTFGKQGNILSGMNKNIYENNKNPSQRYQGLLYQLKK